MIFSISNSLFVEPYSFKLSARLSAKLLAKLSDRHFDRLSEKLSERLCARLTGRRLEKMEDIRLSAILIISNFYKQICTISLFFYCKQIHSGRKCLPRVAYLWSKMPMFQRAGMREGGKPLPLAFQYFIPMI